MLRRLQDELRLLVEGLERGDPMDYSALAADVLEELELHRPDEDLGSEYMVREEVREVLVTRFEAYADLARAIARIEEARNGRRSEYELLVDSSRPLQVRRHGNVSALPFVGDQGATKWSPQGANYSSP